MSDISNWLAEPLETERLYLRPTRPGDEEWIIRMFTDEEVRRYLGGVVSEEAARAASQITGERWGYFAIIERESDKAVGSLSFAQRHGPWELSFELLSDFWGQGLAGEAIKAALCWFFDATDETEVSAVTQVENTRSCRLLEQLGAIITEEFEYRDTPVRRYMFKK